MKPYNITIKLKTIGRSFEDVHQVYEWLMKEADWEKDFEMTSINVED